MTRKVTQLFLILMCALFCSLAPVTARADGAVYALTNALTQNQVLVYRRAKDGTLTLTQTIATGGGGSGLQLAGADSLGSQGSLILNAGHRLLFAVNTETLATNDGTDPTYDCQEGTITSFLVANDGSLTFADKVASGGLYPNSLTIRGGLLYVLNAGGPGLDPACSGTTPNISGFTVNGSGQMKPLANSLRAIDPGHLYGTGFFLDCDPGGFPAGLFDCGLNPPAFVRSPAKVGFTPDGDQLVVTVKATNTIYVFGVGENGTLGYPTLSQATGPNQPTYFGFVFDTAGHMIVTEPLGGTPTIPADNAGTVSSFTITKSGELHPISASIANGQSLSCWVVLEPITEKYAYIANNGSGNISIYSVASSGRLKLLTAAAAVANGANNLAVARQGDTSFLYSDDGGDGTVGAFVIHGDGSITSLGYYAGLPVNAGAEGLAAY